MDKKESIESYLLHQIVKIIMLCIIDSIILNIENTLNNNIIIF